MKAKNLCEAWTMAAEIFPTPYHKDEQSSKHAGYNIYRSDYFNRYYCYICELGDRLEINLDDGRTINIWIAPEEDENGNPAEEIRAAVVSMHDMEAYGAKATAHSMETRINIEFCIENYTHSNDKEKAIYKALRDESRRHFYISELVTAYCEANGLKWASIGETKAEHYSNGNGGHFIISAYITPRTDYEEMYTRSYIKYIEAVADTDTERQLQAEGETDILKMIMRKTYGRRAAAEIIKRAEEAAKYIVYGDETETE